MIKTFSTIILLLLGVGASFAQSTAEINNIDFSVDNDQMTITYDIVKASDKEHFSISICIKTTSGKTINPTSLSGDVGDNIKGGKKKKIVWAITKDNTYIDEEGYVEITAKSIIEQTLPVANNNPVVNNNSTTNKKQVGRGKALLFSTLLPGWGNAKLSGGKPFWIIGIVSYGSLIGGALISGQSVTAYDQYQVSTIEEDRDKLFKKAQGTRSQSNIAFMSAGALWAGDLIFTVIQAKKKNKATSMNKHISVGYEYNTAMQQPLMMVRYKFN